LSTHGSRERARTALDVVLQRAGAVFARRGRRSLVVSFGSAAGELSACVSAVGMADFSQLIKLELSGLRWRLAELVCRMTGGRLASGGLLKAGGAWWCGAGGRANLPPERVIVLGEGSAGERLRELLVARVDRIPGVTVRDRSDEWAAIAIVGAAAPRVLDSLGVFGACGDPRAVAPFSLGSLAGGEAMWLLASDHHALAVMTCPDATGAWHAIEQVGRPHRICLVGQDAVARYTLLQRRAADRWSWPAVDRRI
jgi:glycine cleavage system aminomethyltransferase T